MRHFTNTLGDWNSDTQVQIDHAYWSSVIENTCKTVVQNTKSDLSTSDGGLYVGNAGVAYMLHRLSTIQKSTDGKKQYLQQAVKYIEVSLRYFESKQCRDPPSSFLLGAAGVYAVGALIYNDLGDSEMRQRLCDKYRELASHCLSPGDYLKCGSDELFVGRAGYLSGAYWLNKHLGQEVVNADTLRSICQRIIVSGRTYANEHKSHSPLMYAYYNTEYLGAAHGLCSILQMLMSCPDFVKSDSAIEKDIRASVDFFLQLRQQNSNWPAAMDEITGHRRRSSGEELIHWCHGAPGIVYMFAKAYKIWGDDRYLQACIDSAELTWEKGLLKKGPGICHGIAGSAYVFLLLYRLTKLPKYLHRSSKFAEFLLSDEFKRAARTPDSPYSLYEGLAGTVCYLTDILNPDSSEFPFFDVF